MSSRPVTTAAARATKASADRAMPAITKNLPRPGVSAQRWPMATANCANCRHSAQASTTTRAWMWPSSRANSTPSTSTGSHIHPRGALRPWNWYSPSSMNAKAPASSMLASTTESPSLTCPRSMYSTYAAQCAASASPQ